jgi:hypothetical protein
LRYASLCEKGNNLAVLGRKDPTQLEARSASMTNSLRPMHPPLAQSGALQKASALELLGRASEALLAYYDVLDAALRRNANIFGTTKPALRRRACSRQTRNGNQRSAFMKKWRRLKGRVRLEARSRIKQLRLEHFIPWE